MQKAGLVILASYAFITSVLFGMLAFSISLIGEKLRKQWEG